MKLELVEETRFGHHWPWYTLHVNGEEVYGSWSKHLVIEMYNKIEREKKFEKTVKNILQSSEISLSSQETNNNQ